MQAENSPKNKSNIPNNMLSLEIDAEYVRTKE